VSSSNNTVHRPVIEALEAYHHVNPYGRIELDMATRLPMAA
jgi:hypothetical protein